MSNPPDVGAILESLRYEVRARRLAHLRGADSPAEQDLRRSLDEIELHRVVSAHWPLDARTPFQRVIALFNKIVRRMLRWYINPIIEQQNAYNDAVARTLRALADSYSELAEHTRASEPSDPSDTPDSPPLNHPPAPLADSSQAPDYQALMQLVRDQAAQEPPARFHEEEVDELSAHLRLRQEVNAHWPLPATTPIQRGVALAHKLIRRYLRWLINPIVEQQNAANGAFTESLLALARLDAERRAEVARTRANRKLRV